MTERDTFKYPEQDRSMFGRFRDHLAYVIATFALKWIATQWYEAMIAGSVRLGLDAARREARAERAFPSDQLIPKKGGQTDDRA